MRPGFFYYRRHTDRRNLLRALLLFAISGIVALLLVAAVQMRPLLSSLATTKVSNAVTSIVSEAVYEAIENGELQYDGLVTFEKDNEGKITAVHSNMAAFNHLQAEILHTVLNRIDHVSTRDLSIPIGSLTGSALLAGRGPRITVRMAVSYTHLHPGDFDPRQYLKPARQAIKEMVAHKIVDVLGCDHKAF